jgi:hypothetical protein
MALKSISWLAVAISRCPRAYKNEEGLSLSRVKYAKHLVSSLEIEVASAFKITKSLLNLSMGDTFGFEWNTTTFPFLPTPFKNEHFWPIISIGLT